MLIQGWLRSQAKNSFLPCRNHLLAKIQRSSDYDHAQKRQIYLGYDGQQWIYILQLHPIVHCKWSPCKQLIEILFTLTLFLCGLKRIGYFSKDFYIDYKKCHIPSNTIEIGLYRAIGLGPIGYSLRPDFRITGVFFMPTPIQDTLTTVVRGCDSKWYVQNFIYDF